MLYWHMASYNVSGNVMTVPKESQPACECGRLYIHKKYSIKQLAIDFDVSFAYAKILVTTTHIT